jgi:hypothetical protein
VKSIDITNKSDPIILSDIFVDGINGVGLAINENDLFVGACAEGIRIVDISNPSNLQALGFYDDYQDIYCDGGGDYALYPKIYQDATEGTLLVFVSSSCGLNIISIDDYEFEIEIIPGYDIFFLVFTAIASIVLVYMKLHRRKIS